MLPTLESMQNDDLVMTVARVRAVANQAASAQGTKLGQSLVTIFQEAPPAEHVCGVH